MLIREVNVSEKQEFNRVATHPLQAWEWGEFREKTGVTVIRLGAFEGTELKLGYQVTIHKVPYWGVNVGYFPKGPMPDDQQIEALKNVGKEHNCILVKLEPNVGANQDVKEYLSKQGCRPGRPLFTRYTFQVDLRPTEEELMAKMKPKTRYNIGVAQKYGVVVREDNAAAAVDEFIRLTQETTKRQGFYAHSEDYQRLMWETLSKTGMAKLLTATWQGKMLAAWVVFVFNGVIYYPYGASSAENREVMASNLMMWEIIRLGKKLGCTILDMWGALGPVPDQTDPWYGFHRFKEGYGGSLVEFAGSWDLVLKPSIYPLYRLAEEWRWKVLRLKARIWG